MHQYYIDNTKSIPETRLYLLDSQMNTVGELLDAYNKKYIIKFNNINELSFTVPYVVDIRRKLKANPNIYKFTKKNYIKLVIEEIGYEEIYTISQKSKSYGETDELNVQCYSLGYELRRSRMIGYEVISYTCSQVLADCLKGTGWSIGYINEEFDQKYRSFSVSSQTNLEFLNDIADTFDAKIVYDTINQKISLYKEDELSIYQGFWLSSANYIQTLEESEDEDEIITRLVIKGADDLTINGVNPTGQSYIDDFSYYYSVMSPDLKSALETYSNKLETHELSLSGLLSQKSILQTTLTEQNNTLSSLNSDLQIILDNIQIAKQGGNSTDDLITERDDKMSEISTQEALIKTTENSISTIESNVKEITTSLSYESNLTALQLEELKRYISVDEWSDSNIDDASTLMQEGRKYLTEKNFPSINISLSIINFFKIVSEQYNWKRFGIGNIIRVECDNIGTLVDATVQEFSVDEENDNMGITVSNAKRVSDEKREFFNKLLKGETQTQKDYNYTKAEIEAATYNFNTRNDRISDTPVFPTFLYDDNDVTYTMNDNGSVDITVNWQYPDHEETQNNAHNIDGFEVFLYTDTIDAIHIFGSNIDGKDTVTVPPSTRSLSFTGKVSNKYYTMGIRAFRVVDPDVNANRIIYSSIVNFPETPYRPNDEVAVIGRLNGVGYYSGETSPINPKLNDEWTDTSGASPIKKVYNGTKWVEIGTSNSSIINPTTLNVKDYGAIGDGIIDDTTAFQNAVIDASEKGIPLFIPKGNFYIKSWIRLYSNVTINLSDDAWVIKKVGASTNKVFQVLSDTSKGYGSGARNIVINGGNFKGDLDNDISIDNSFHHASDLIIRNINVEHGIYRGHFADLMGCENVLIENCTFKGFKLSDDRFYTECIQIDNSSYVGAGGSDNVLSYDGLPTHDVIIRDCEFLPILNDDGTIKYYAPNITGNHSAIRGLPAYNLTVDNNVIKGGAPLYGDSQGVAGWIHYRGGYNISIKNNKFVNLFSNLSKPISIYKNVYAHELSNVANSDSTTTAGIPNDCYNIRVESNYFEGFDFADVSNICQFSGTDLDGVTYKITDLYIQSNTYKNCFDTSQIGERVSGDLNNIQKVSRITLSDNSVESARRLAFIQNCDNITVSKNKLSKVYYIPISIRECSNGYTSDNVFDSCIAAISIGGASQNIRVNGNQIDNPLVPGNVYDSVVIDVIGTSSSINVADNTINGNSNVTTGIYASATTGIGYIKDNIVKGITTKVQIDSGSGMIASNNL